MPSAVALPAYALLSAAETVASGLPVAALISSAIFSPSCAWARSPVPRASVASAGRSSSSATAVRFDVAVMNPSTDAMALSVAPVVLSSERVNWSCAAWSCMAALAASIAPAARATRAMPAGTAALRTARVAFCPLVWRSLNALLAELTPLALKSVMIGIVIAITAAPYLCDPRQPLERPRRPGQCARRGVRRRATIGAVRMRGIAAPAS